MIGAICNHYHPKNKAEALILDRLCYHSARLRNTGVYNARQYFFEHKAYIGKKELSSETRKNENYGMMITDMADQTINHVDRDFRSYFGNLKSLKEEKAETPETKRKVRLPKYLDKDGIWSLFVAGRSVRIRPDGIHIGLTERFRKEYDIKQQDLVLGMKLPIEGKDIAQLEIKPRFGGEFYDITVVHKEAEGQEKKETAKKKPKARKKEKPRVLSCDVGVDNLLSVFSYPDGDMFLIRGGAVKAMNQWYNKRMAELQSIYESQGMKSGTAMTLLIMKRENFMDNELSCIAKHLVDYAIEKDIKAVVIGWNKGIKDEINIGKVNNQKFVSIPYQKLFQKKTSLGVIEYFSRMKINAAKEMIRTGRMNFTQISETLGYTSIHYFSRQFKKIAGMTPSEYASSIKAVADGSF